MANLCFPLDTTNFWLFFFFLPIHVLLVGVHCVFYFTTYPRWTVLLLSEIQYGDFIRPRSQIRCQKLQLLLKLSWFLRVIFKTDTFHQNTARKKGDRWKLTTSINTFYERKVASRNWQVSSIHSTKEGWPVETVTSIKGVTGGNWQLPSTHSTKER